MTPPRMKAEDRRRHVLEAAMHEFAQGGYDSVSVTAIADRAGVSQPYVFRLFGTKKGLFIASIEERTAQILEAFRTSVAGAPADLPPLDAMAAAYLDLMANDPFALRCQLYAWASAADPEIGEAARASYLSIWRLAAELSGQDSDSVRDFMAQGMLLTVLAALDITQYFAEPDLLVQPSRPSDNQE